MGLYKYKLLHSISFKDDIVATAITFPFIKKEKQNRRKGISHMIISLIFFNVLGNKRFISVNKPAKNLNNRVLTTNAIERSKAKLVEFK